jgi:hypothetical protein
MRKLIMMVSGALASTVRAQVAGAAAAPHTNAQIASETKSVRNRQLTREHPELLTGSGARIPMYSGW